VGCQLGRLGPLTGWRIFSLARPTLSGTAVSLVGGDPGVPMCHICHTPTIKITYTATIC
jgi:hypothetical protein